MNELVQTSKQGEIGILTVNNPPVNALSPGVPEGIAAGIEEFEKDPSVKAIVLIGGGRTFIAGADIKEFGKITAGGDRKRGPGLTAVPDRIDASTKPVVAAIHGTKTLASDRRIPVPSVFSPLLDRALRFGPPFDKWQNSRRDIVLACKRAGIPVATWNDLRRTFASLLVQLGVAPHVVARLLGHTTTAMVDKVYGRTTAETLGTLMERQLGGTNP